MGTPLSLLPFGDVLAQTQCPSPTPEPIHPTPALGLGRCRLGSLVPLALPLSRTSPQHPQEAPAVRGGRFSLPQGVPRAVHRAVAQHLHSGGPHHCPSVRRWFGVRQGAGRRSWLQPWHEIWSQRGEIIRREGPDINLMAEPASDSVINGLANDPRRGTASASA